MDCTLFNEHAAWKPTNFEPAVTNLEMCWAKLPEAQSRLPKLVQLFSRLSSINFGLEKLPRDMSLSFFTDSFFTDALGVWAPGLSVYIYILCNHLPNFMLFCISCLTVLV